MSSPVRVKICGLRDAAMVEAACAAGAAYVGFVFFPKSPRHVSAEVAQQAAWAAPPGVAKVALMVNPDDALLDAVNARVPLDMIQLHGQESPERVAEVRALTGLPVMKAVGVAGKADLAALDTYGAVADQLLVDARPPEDGVLPGGNGIAFDWRLIANRRWPVPWMLAGGLTPENVAEAIALTGAAQVDVSTGVERSRGEKDPEKIAAFIAATEGAGAPIPRLRS